MMMSTLEKLRKKTLRRMINAKNSKKKESQKSGVKFTIRFYCQGVRNALQVIDRETHARSYDKELIIFMMSRKSCIHERTICC